MNHKTPSQQKHFDDLYELYHFNPFHDKMGRFSTSSRSASSYVSRSGRLKDKALRNLKTSRYESEESIERRKRYEEQRKEAEEAEEKRRRGGLEEAPDMDSLSRQGHLDPNYRSDSPGGGKSKKKNKSSNSDNSDNSNDGNDNNDQNSGEGKNGKKDKDKGIRIDENGRVHPDDQNKAIHEIENQISKDWSNKSKMLSDSSRLVNDLNRFRDKNRDRAAKTKAASEDLSSWSNEELKSYIDKRTERMNLERKYRDLRETDYNKGRAKLDDLLDTAGTILALGATAATIAATIHTLKS